MRKTADPKTKKSPPLVLKRESVRVLDDEALHQVMGGGKASSSNRMMLA